MFHKITNFNQKSRGFTIVELLVVIVVIGILATITIVSYTGITQKANSTKALSNAQSVLSVTEVFASAENFYPAITDDLITGKRAQATAVTKLASGINLTTGAIPATDGTANAEPGAVNGASTIWYQYCGATAAPANTAATGGRIRYWDFVTAAMATNVIYFGTGAAGLGVGAGTVCHTWVTPTT
jgi:prepilin-type N-terminal cleavage/methylation domain-containing protein